MKRINNSVLRSAFAMILGFVLVLWPEAAVTYLVITIGICFIIPGIFSLLNYFTREKVEGEPSPMFPIDGAGSILFGAWLVIMPEFFVNILMYILGALLVIAGVQANRDACFSPQMEYGAVRLLRNAGPDLTDRHHDHCLSVRGRR